MKKSRDNLIERPGDIQELKKIINTFPVTAILGARQSGKTTISKQFDHNHYFDLENPRDLVKFENPQLLLEDLTGTIVIDEIQRKPDLFPLLRYLVDTNKNQKYIILGSASRDLIKQSSETLAGRIGYYILEGFRIGDIKEKEIQKLWLQGGFPKSFLSTTEESILWRENYIRTFLERDIPQLGISIPAQTLRRFWTILSHYHGQIINYSELARSFGLSDVTAKRYIDILTGTFMVQVLMPWHSNTKKRLVKAPKIYIKDSGILHSLMAIDTMDQLLSHNKLGASWEGFAFEQVFRSIGKSAEDVYFWSTHSGAEIDLFWVHGGKNWGVENKYSDAPKVTKSMMVALEDLDLEHIWVVYPGKDRYALHEKITVIPVKEVSSKWVYL